MLNIKRDSSLSFGMTNDDVFSYLLKKGGHAAPLRVPRGGASPSF